MKEFQSGCLLLLAVALWAGVHSPSWAQDTDKKRDDLARQIRQTVEQLQQIRQARNLAETEHAENLARVQRQIDRLQQQLAQAETTASTVQETINGQQTKLDQHRQSKRWADQQFDVIVSRSRALAQSIHRQLEKNRGPRFYRRLARIDNILTSLTIDDRHRQQEGVQALFAFLGDEWKASREVTLSNESIFFEDGKKSLHAWVVGFGLVQQVFVSEDNRVVGMQSPNPKQDWKLDLAPAEADHVRHLLEIVRQQKPPQIAPLPVMIRSTSGS